MNASVGNPVRSLVARAVAGALLPLLLLCAGCAANNPGRIGTSESRVQQTLPAVSTRPSSQPANGTESMLFADAAMVLNKLQAVANLLAHIQADVSGVRELQAQVKTEVVGLKSTRFEKSERTYGDMTLGALVSVLAFMAFVLFGVWMWLRRRSERGHKWR